VQEEGLEPDVDRRPSRRRRGIVFAQSPGAGVQLNEGERVELLVSTGLPGKPVPEVVGLREAEAANRLGAAGFKVRIRRAFSERPKGIVTAQNPTPDTRVVEGTTVVITVSKGPKIVVVPDLVGQDQRDAVASLRELDLRANLVQVPSEEPRGIVVAQNPPAGERVQAESAVRLNVSTGSTGTQATTTTATGGGQTPARVRVPDVVGQRQTAALRRLQDAGLRGSVVYVSSSRPAGTVVGQRPAAGTSTARNSVVRLNVSAGTTSQQRRAVPDVIGMDQETATQTLQQAGFAVEVIGRPVTDPSEEGLVVDQQPAGGTRAPRGATITIYVGEAA
jgi:beta-lactam-binding protein with PASTA domain